METMMKTSRFWAGVTVLTLAVFMTGSVNADDRLPNGASCKLNSDCESNQCSFFKCEAVEKKKNGSDCVSDQECSSGECKNFKCQKLQHTKVGNGKKCTFDGDCISGRCEGLNPFNRRCVRR